MKEHEKDLKEVNQSGEDFLHEAKVRSFDIHNHNSVVLLTLLIVAFETLMNCVLPSPGNPSI